jgi:hypothetical protein
MIRTPLVIPITGPNDPALEGALLEALSLPHHLLLTAPNVPERLLRSAELRARHCTTLKIIGGYLLSLGYASG